MEKTTGTIITDFIIIGSGIAGLRAAIEIAPKGKVVILSKESLSESNTEYAQGGIAAALSDDDMVVFHFEDTINAGAGLCDEEAVKILVGDGPTCTKELISWGAEFDREGLKLAFTREGAHTKNRILHAGGDSTGKEIVRVLLNKARTYDNLSFLPYYYTSRLLLGEDGNCLGIICSDKREKSNLRIYARSVILATGGSGRLYQETTNPTFATGDGMAIAYRAGAVLKDMEFVQFHPTSLFLPGCPRFLLSESLRGEGGKLVNAKGERFMSKYHKFGDLAPRDVVSRSIITELKETQTCTAYLDLTDLDPDFVKKRFPRIYQTCHSFGLDVTRKPIPIYPSAHYIMGGVKTDTWGRTSIEGLYAAGEVACTGVHGANRLASNSLLEGLVFGHRAGKAVVEAWISLPKPDSEIKDEREARIPPDPNEFDRVRVKIGKSLWAHVGIIRNKSGLRRMGGVLNHLSFLDDFRYCYLTRREMETLNIYHLARIITASALFREESRGSHFREDFPKKDDKNWKVHTLAVKGPDGKPEARKEL